MIERSAPVELRSLADAYRAALPACLRLCVVSSIILSAFGLALIPFKEEVLYRLAGLFLPSDWLTSFQMANSALFHQMGSALLFQTVAIVCFSVISLFFFIPRDRISLRTEARLTRGDVPHTRLIKELWLEAGLVMIALNVYSATYLAAYFVGQPLFSWIDELAFVLLMLFFTVDLLSPTHFRRNLNSLFVFGVMRKRPVELLLFALFFCSPIFVMELFLGDLVYNQQDTATLAAALVAIIVLNCIVCVFAIPLGTWLALPSVLQHAAANPPGRGLLRHKVFYGVQLGITLLLVLFYGSVIGILSTKVPLKSAQYDIQWRTLGYESGVNGEPPTLRFDIRIFNRHESLGLQVDNAELLLNLDGRYLGEANLNIPYVPPNTVVDVPVELRIKVDFSELAGIATDELFSYFTGEAPAWRESLQARLMVQLPLGLRLPLYITEGYRHEFQEE